jgi:hypothetical protein
MVMMIRWRERNEINRGVCFSFWNQGSGMEERSSLVLFHELVCHVLKLLMLLKNMHRAWEREGRDVVTDCFVWDRGNRKNETHDMVLVLNRKWEYIGGWRRSGGWRGRERGSGGNLLQFLLKSWWYGSVIDLMGLMKLWIVLLIKIISLN